MAKTKNIVEYEGRKVSLSQLAQLMGIDKSVLYVRYNCEDRGDKQTRKVSAEVEAYSAKKIDTHEVWGGTWYYKGQKVFTDERLKALRGVRGG